jgi:hypothetical protein
VASIEQSPAATGTVREIVAAHQVVPDRKKKDKEKHKLKMEELLD